MPHLENDLPRYNPSAAKRSAPRIVVPTMFLCLLAPGCATLPESVANPPAAAIAERTPRVNLNTASARELEGLPGIGATMAARIVAHRQLYGAFRRAEHLMMVRGISDAKFRAIQPLITVD